MLYYIFFQLTVLKCGMSQRNVVIIVLIVTIYNKKYIAIYRLTFFKRLISQQALFSLIKVCIAFTFTHANEEHHNLFIIKSTTLAAHIAMHKAED